MIKDKSGQTQYQFDNTTALNIGNPQKVGQGTITFNRQVMAGCIYRPLLETDAISEDAKARCELIKSEWKSPIGAYTQNSKGGVFFRKSVADFINRRDGVDDSHEDNIFMTNGASEGVRIAFASLIRNSNDGILVPIPQYPLYSALITLGGGELMPYYLNEDAGWTCGVEDIERSIDEARLNGVAPRAIVVINPGNPTGQVMDRETLESIVKVAYEHQILIMADEVYQQNVYKEGKEFISMRKVIAEMGDPYSDAVELISMNSTSKGILGECGLRGGYFETHNLSNRAEEMLYKLKSIELCSNTPGQIATHLMVDPPQVARESADCVDLYNKEAGFVMGGMKERAKLLCDSFNEMKQVTCTEIEGAMYGFPKLHFSQKFIDAALA